MSGEDWSDYSSDDPEYEISDHLEMSDSDGSYSDTDDDEDIPTVSFNNWNVLSDPFADKIPRPLQDFSADYDFHPAIDFQECKDPVNCFEHFMSPNIVAKLYIPMKYQEKTSRLFSRQKDEEQEDDLELKWKMFMVVEGNLIRT
ncbi:hypothetical protein FQA39_LY08256 [Lamprigera yunnana]|nr:hypothetical protein FQA39_LY08256 [Lamprigera yunnana]